ncbi:MAG: outer membrane protein assembly factor BamD [Pseudomonadota bacterium]
MIRFQPLSALLLIGFLMLLSACSNNRSTISALSEQGLFETAQNQLRKNRFILAVETLEKLEADFPFGKYANSAQLALIYAYYKTEEYALSDASASRFIRLHPNHPNVDYAYYLRGLAAFPRAATMFQQAFNSDLSKRDMSSPRTSFVNFSELTRRFPESPYASDALKRMEYLRNLLARHEMGVANYYLDRKAYIAAANRARNVVENFQQSPAVPDALAVMVQSYTALNMTALADRSLAALRLNYPDYPALEGGEFDFGHYREGTSSIVGTLTFGLIDYSKPPGFDSREQYGEF